MARLRIGAVVVHRPTGRRGTVVACPRDLWPRVHFNDNDGFSEFVSRTELIYLRGPAPKAGMIPVDGDVE